MPTITPTRDLPAITEGDDIHFPVSFVDPSGNPIDISGWTISTTVKSYDGGSPVIQKDVTNHRNATGGETGFEFQAGETAGLSGSYRYDIQVTKGNGEIRTVVIGTLPFVDGVTDRTPGSGGSGGDAAGGGVGISVALGTDSIAVDVLMGAGTFGPSDAVAAMDGATITPAQVGTQSNPFTGYVDELSVGTTNAPPFPSRENLVETETSTSLGYAVAQGHGTGYFPPLQEYEHGTMAMKCRILARLKTSDSSQPVDIQALYVSESGNFNVGPSAKTTSTSYEVVDTGWFELTRPSDPSKPFQIRIRANSGNSSTTATIDNASLHSGIGPTQ